MVVMEPVLVEVIVMMKLQDLLEDPHTGVVVQRVLVTIPVINIHIMLHIMHSYMELVEVLLMRHPIQQVLVLMEHLV